MTQLKMWKEYPDWQNAEQEWDRASQEAQKKFPIKTLEKLPNMVGITPDTAKNLKWKSFKWMISKDHDRTILKSFFKHPLKYGWRYFKSLFQPVPFKREGDFFLYGVEAVNDFHQMLSNQDAIFVLGFSYCHKPFECPSGRFTPDCIHDITNPVCQQCFIGKAMNAAPDTTIKLAIPTVHYIGQKMFEIVHANPTKQVLFLISACEMTLQMFGDWGNMVGIRGVGVRLDGRICNTMKAFELSEGGIKPGLTVVLGDTQKKILELLKQRSLHSL